MPSFTLDGYVEVNDVLTPITAEAVFANRVDSLSYRYFGGETIQLLTGLPRSFTVDGTEVLETADFLLSQVNWGSGLTTYVLDVTQGDASVFSAELGGVALLDDLVAVGRAGGRELARTIAYFGQVEEGDFAPRTEIPLETLFAQDLEDLSQLGSGGANRLTGTRAQDVLWGLGGRDVLNGRGGDDTILAGAGRDTAKGQGGADMISGFSGNDRLFGGGGNDVLGGGAGNDLLVGGKGADTFAFDRLPGNDTIRDMEARDSLVFDSRLWADGITPEEIVDSLEVSGDGLVLPFGRGTITFLGLDVGDIEASQITLF